MIAPSHDRRTAPTREELMREGVFSRVEAMAFLRIGKDSFNRLVNHPEPGEVGVPCVVVAGRRLYPVAGLKWWLAQRLDDRDV